MLNKYIKIAGLSAFLFASTASASELLTGLSIGVNAEKGVYTRENRDIFDTATVKDNTKVDGSYALTVAIQQIIDGGFGLGAEFGYRISGQKAKNGDTVNLPSTRNEMFTALATAAYIADIGMVNPYAKVGIGGAKINFELVAGDNGKDVTLADGYKIAYQIELGVAGVICDNALVTASVKYFGLTDIDKDDATDAATVFIPNGIKAHTGDLTVGVGVHFVIS